MGDLLELKYMLVKGTDVKAVKIGHAGFDCWSQEGRTWNVTRSDLLRSSFRDWSGEVDRGREMAEAKGGGFLKITRGFFLDVG